MREMDVIESQKCTGGAAKIIGGVYILGVALVSFLLGVIDGITNPKACNIR